MGHGRAINILGQWRAIKTLGLGRAIDILGHWRAINILCTFGATWKQGNSEAEQLGSRASQKQGNSESGQLGGGAFWKQGNLEAGQLEAGQLRSKQGKLGAGHFGSRTTCNQDNLGAIWKQDNFGRVGNFGVTTE